MNILVLVDVFWPDHVGGISKSLLPEVEHLVDRGHKIVVLSRRLKRGLPPYESYESFELYRYPSPAQETLLYRLYPLFTIRQVAKILPSLNKQFQFDVAYVHNPFQAVGLLRSSERIPYVYVFHAPIPREVEIEAKKGKYGIVTPLVKMANHWIRGKEIYALIYAHKIIVRSRYMEKEMVQLYSDLGRGKTLRIPLCVDTQRFSFAENPTILREQLNLPVHRPVMLTVRRLVPRMGLENLILAMKEIVKQVPEALLLIGGKGYLENSLRTLIMRLQLEANVKLLGFIPEEELPMYYQSADLFVLPTVELEGFGLSTLEALSCGTPVIATPVGANPEVIGPLGQEFLCQDASPESLAERIVWFIKRANSNELRKRCREYCEANFRVDKVVGAIEQVLLEVATGR